MVFGFGVPPWMFSGPHMAASLNKTKKSGGATDLKLLVHGDNSLKKLKTPCLSENKIVRNKVYDIFLKD